LENRKDLMRTKWNMAQREFWDTVKIIIASKIKKTTREVFSINKNE
jgi:hypothetical protein